MRHRRRSVCGPGPAGRSRPAPGNGRRHRSPRADAEGFWVEPGVGLVHRRLSIIDLAGGDQAIGNEDGSDQGIFNGEIYNFRELRSGLEAAEAEISLHSVVRDGNVRFWSRSRGPIGSSFGKDRVITWTGVYLEGRFTASERVAANIVAVHPRCARPGHFG